MCISLSIYTYIYIYIYTHTRLCPERPLPSEGQGGTGACTAFEPRRRRSSSSSSSSSRSETGEVRGGKPSWGRARCRITPWGEMRARSQTNQTVPVKQIITRKWLVKQTHFFSPDQGTCGRGDFASRQWPPAPPMRLATVQYYNM